MQESGAGSVETRGSVYEWQVQLEVSSCRVPRRVQLKARSRLKGTSKEKDNLQRGELESHQINKAV
jgi:hypothetical protein